MKAKIDKAGARAVLLKRRGLVFVEPTGSDVSETVLRAFEADLAGLGYVPSTGLRRRLAQTSLQQLSALREHMLEVLAAELGADRRWKPLFARFPEDVPSDTYGLWVHCVLCHFFQAQGQACLSCGELGTTHVLGPCMHVVCDRCFDGSNYTGCPVCGHAVPQGSPFFQPSPELERSLPKERVTFKRLELGADLEAACQAWFVQVCERKQAMSPADKADLLSMVRARGNAVLPWLPPGIAVRENVALVFGTLLQSCAADRVLPEAKRYIRTATDVLRLVAAFSDADPGLLPQTAWRMITSEQDRKRWPLKKETLQNARSRRPACVLVKAKRFKVKKLSRPLRRMLLALLESFEEESLIEDMLRHRSYWVWLGEFLHPHEYAKRFPKVARAFAIVRKKGPDGTPAPVFVGFYGKLEAAARMGDASGLASLLEQRPGELARRFDHALRVAGTDVAARTRLLELFTANVRSFSLPVLMTLLSHLPTRSAPAARRIYFPKSSVGKGVAAPERRSSLAQEVVATAVDAIETELLRRFAAKPPVSDMVIDVELASIIAPFNERTASPAAINLPRGSRVRVPASQVVRMFMHWCEPERGETTDIDLSVAFFDSAWKHCGVCSYYNLNVQTRAGEPIARSSGDYTSAPFPHGASEFVDLHRSEALAAGYRYAVMVVTAYAGLPFSQLERAFAGIMLRSDIGGAHFDPRSVALRFAIQGEHGVFMPLVFDLEQDVMHWIDVYSKGQLQANNVANAQNDIATVCSQLITYFASGARSSMHDLALLHGAARAERVYLRGAETMRFERRPDESARSFLSRLRTRTGAEPGELSELRNPTLAVLQRGDLDLPPESSVYALFPERLVSTLSASDLLS